SSRRRRVAGAESCAEPRGRTPICWLPPHRGDEEEPVSDATGAGPDSLDRIAADLLALKEANPISYAEIGRRIGEQRVARGVPAAAAYPPRSTVYDVFRAGRTRIDPDLLRDIVTALGGDEAEVERWAQRARQLRRPTEPTARQRVAPTARP